jgi:hypothetical protein
MTTDGSLEFDVRRSILLGGYIQHWGLPAERQSFTRGDDRVEVYSFPATGNVRVSRVASVGASTYVRDGRYRAEFMMALPGDLGGATFAQVAGFLMDVALYAQQDDVRLREGMVIPPSPLVPEAWVPRALLVDLPRSEPEELASVHVGIQHVNLWWVIPIYVSEYELICQSGLEAFDELEQASESSLADVRRPPLVHLAPVGPSSD